MILLHLLYFKKPIKVAEGQSVQSVAILVMPQAAIVYVGNRHTSSAFIYTSFQKFGASKIFFSSKEL